MVNDDRSQSIKGHVRLLIAYYRQGTINLADYGRVYSAPSPAGTAAYLFLTRPNLAVIFGDPIQGLYTTNASSPLGRQQGVRPYYKFGLYSYCAYLNESAVQCSNRTAGFKFQPYAYVVSDMSANYSQYTTAFYAGTQFQNNAYLASSSHAAYWMLLLGALCAVFALATSVFHLGSSTLPQR